ncbi:hypothetical protein [Longispora fulva]|uniref:Uncharacterized protein n=2 Tax=Longispora fulva TaxID=619741 RepID=A0A8J7GDG1_9ACTN|nr:hypothetical protein [Longispora fulva]MBG6135965.1 hypothetical protein [Longispora fulva]
MAELRAPTPRQRPSPERPGRSVRAGLAMICGAAPGLSVVGEGRQRRRGTLYGYWAG